MDAAVTGCPRGSAGAQFLPFPAPAFIATPEATHRGQALPYWHGRLPAGQGASCHLPCHHQGASGLSSSYSDLSGRPRNLENLTLSPFVMLLAHPEKEKLSDFSLLYL